MHLRRRGEDQRVRRQCPLLPSSRPLSRRPSNLLHTPCHRISSWRDPNWHPLRPSPPMLEPPQAPRALSATLSAPLRSSPSTRRLHLGPSPSAPARVGDLSGALLIHPRHSAPFRPPHTCSSVPDDANTTTRKADRRFFLSITAYWSVTGCPHK